MDIASLTGSGSPVGGNDGTQKAFREADFLAIMLTEITNQDPFEPSETSKIVENMQKLQELANTNFEKFRADLRWGQDLVGQPVTVSQANLTVAEAVILAERGVNADIGYDSVQGVVSGYRTVGETVWITVDGKDYPIDNVQQIRPPGADPQQVSEVASGLIGRTVRFVDPATGVPDQGVVDGVDIGEGSQLTLRIGDRRIPFEAIRGING